jgi:hypothetical protein
MSSSNISLTEGTRFRNRNNRKIGRVVTKAISGYSINYDDGNFEISLSPKDMDILPDVNHNTLVLEEQESFMHLLYDVVHIGVSVSSLDFRIDSLNHNFDLKYLLNIPMKDEKYSEELILPLVKVIKQERNFQESDEEFYGRKIKVMKVLVENGASLSINLNLDFDDLKERRIINYNIINYIKN